jgi:hypothetical protein
LKGEYLSAFVIVERLLRSVVVERLGGSGIVGFSLSGYTQSYRIFVAVIFN